MSHPLKEDELIEKDNIAKVRELLYVAIAFLLLSPIIIVNIAIILLVLIFVYDLYRKQLKLKYNKLAYSLPAIFLIYAVSLCYSQNISIGLKMLETKFSLLLVPALLCAYPISARALQKIKIGFIAGCLTASLLCILNAFYIGYSRTGGISILDNQYFYDRDFFVSIIGIHPPFFGLYLTAALLFLLSLFHKINSVIRAVGLFIVAALLLWTLLLIHARMAQISLMLLLLVWMIFILIQKRSLLILFSGVVILAGTSALAFYHPFLNKRMMEVINTPLREPTSDEDNSVSLRYGQIYCSIQLLKDHPMLGVGIGDMQQELNKCYTDRNYHPVFTTNNLNTHNQFLDMGLSSGLIGLLLLLIIIARLILYFYRNEDILAVVFMLLISMAALTESILNSFKGVILFSFFCSVFLAFQNGKQKNSKLENITDHS